VPKNPLGMDVGSDGTLYYAELNLDPATFNPRCGSVSMVKFDAAGNSPLTLGRICSSRTASPSSSRPSSGSGSRI